MAGYNSLPLSDDFGENSKLNIVEQPQRPHIK